MFKLLNLFKKFKEYSFKDIFIVLVLLFTPIDVALRITALGETTVINYIILILDIILLIGIIKKNVYTNNLDKINIIFVVLYLIYSLFFLIPDITLFHLTSFRIGSLLNCSVLFVFLTFTKFNQSEYNLFLYCSAFSIYIAGLFYFSSENIASLQTAERLYLTVGATIDPNTSGTNFCLAMSSLFEIIVNEEIVYWRIMCIISFFILLSILIMIGSRGALLGMLSIVAINISLRRQRLFPSKIGLYYFIIAFILILVSIKTVDFMMDYLSDKFFERYNINLIIEGGGSGRLTIWKKMIEHINNNFTIKEFLFGTGFSTFKFVSPAGKASHNIYLNIFVESGFFGFCIFMYLIFSLLIKAYYNRNYFGFSSLFGLCVCGLSLEMQTLRIFWIAMWICTWNRPFLRINEKK